MENLYSSQEAIVAGQQPRINTPMLWVNKYLQEKLANSIKVAVPFFPTSPTSIEDLTESWLTINGENYEYAGVLCSYDRLIKMRRKAFPHVKSEQLLYYFYATQSGVTDNMIAVTETTLRLFDNEDESAQDINAWAMGKTININGVNIVNEFYFHKFKVYQLEETRDIIDFGTARTYGGNKIIIDYDYHRVPVDIQYPPN
jgi:hypothetical protein